MAAELKVAKRTVETAYDILIGEGYLITKGSKGTIVNSELIIHKSKSEKKIEIEDNELASIIKVRNAKGLFGLGVPAFDHFPYKKWLLVSSKAIRKMEPDDLKNLPVMGYLPLREAIAKYLNISRGIDCIPEQIIITSGYKHSIALILNSLAKKNDKVVFEDPGYIFGQKLLKRTINKLYFNPVDSQGLNTEYFKKYNQDARFVLTTPSHQSPLTVTLSLARRHELLEWADSNKSWLIEDDYDGEFHYTKKIIPSLKSIDSNDRVIYIGTFSKTIMPSIRTSYIVAPIETVSKFIETSEITETSQPLLTQKILTNFINGGYFYKHLKKMRILYQKRREFVINALKIVFPKFFTLEITDGGMQIIAYLARGTNDQGIFKIWQDNGLLVYPLSRWYTGKNKRYGLVIGFTNIQSEMEAVKAFESVYHETKIFFDNDSITDS